MTTVRARLINSASVRRDSCIRTCSRDESRSSWKTLHAQMQSGLNYALHLFLKDYFGVLKASCCLCCRLCTVDGMETSSLSFPVQRRGTHLKVGIKPLRAAQAPAELTSGCIRRFFRHLSRHQPSFAKMLLFPLCADPRPSSFTHWFWV